MDYNRNPLGLSLEDDGLFGFSAPSPGLKDAMEPEDYNLKDSNSDIFSRYVREELFAPAVANNEFGTPSTLYLDCSFSNLSQQEEQIPAGRGGTASTPPSQEEINDLFHKKIDIEGIDEIFDFNPDLFIVSKENQEELLEELSELPEELHSDLLSLVGTELPRTPSGETILEVSELSADSLWKLKAYVSPLSPSEEKKRPEIELKRKASVQLIQDNENEDGDSSSFHRLKYRRKDGLALDGNEGEDEDEDGGDEDEEPFGDDELHYETEFTSTAISSGWSRPSSTQRVHSYPPSALTTERPSPMIELDDEEEEPEEPQPKKSETFQIQVVVYRVLPHPNDDKPYHCDFEGCGKKFTNSSNLLRHIRVHTAVKPYICCFPNCGKAFSYKTVLMEHAALHNGMKPFECEACGKKFGSKANHRRHIRVHTGEKPFVCSCGKSFSQSSNMKQHSKHCSGRPC